MRATIVALLAAAITLGSRNSRRCRGLAEQRLESFGVSARPRPEWIEKQPRILDRDTHEEWARKFTPCASTDAARDLEISTDSEIGIPMRRSITSAGSFARIV